MCFMIFYARVVSRHRLNRGLQFFLIGMCSFVEADDFGIFSLVTPAAVLFFVFFERNRLVPLEVGTNKTVNSHRVSRFKIWIPGWTPSPRVIFVPRNGFCHVTHCFCLYRSVKVEKVSTLEPDCTTEPHVFGADTRLTCLGCSRIFSRFDSRAAYVCSIHMYTGTLIYIQTAPLESFSHTFTGCT